LGTAHSPVVGLAESRAEGFASPLGVVPLDQDALDALEDLPQVQLDEEAHRDDHALEVQLPFLQEVLGAEAFRLVPLLVGRVEADQVAEVLEQLWGGPETAIVVSSDLSHYLDQASARELDRCTADAIEAMAPERLGLAQACGLRAIAGLLLAARARGLRAET